MFSLIAWLNHYKVTDTSIRIFYQLKFLFILPSLCKGQTKMQTRSRIFDPRFGMGQFSPIVMRVQHDALWD